MTPPRAAFAMIVGPGEQAIACDTLDRIQAFYPEADIWIRDDATRDGTYEAVQAWAAKHPRAFLFRNEPARGFWNLAKSLASLYADIAMAQPGYDIVVKLDTDAVLIGEGLLAHFQELFAHAGPGAIGSYLADPDGTPRNFSILARKMQRDFWPVSAGKRPAYFRLGKAFYARFYEQALRHGYRPGEHVQGGLYALHGETVRALKRSGFLDAIPEQCRHFLCQEDALFGLGVKAVGHALIHCNQGSGPGILWTMHPGPLTVSVAQLRELQTQAIHPCKNDAVGWGYRNAFPLKDAPVLSASSSSSPAG